MDAFTFTSIIMHLQAMQAKHIDKALCFGKFPKTHDPYIIMKIYMNEIARACWPVP